MHSDERKGIKDVRKRLVSLPAPAELHTLGIQHLSCKKEINAAVVKSKATVPAEREIRGSIKGGCFRLTPCNTLLPSGSRDCRPETRNGILKSRRSIKMS